MEFGFGHLRADRASKFRMAFFRSAFLDADLDTGVLISHARALDDTPLAVLSMDDVIAALSRAELDILTARSARISRKIEDPDDEKPRLLHLLLLKKASDSFGPLPSDPAPATRH